MTALDKTNFAQVVRLMWIDDLIDNEGQINRGDVARGFRISVQQASHDLALYRELNPRRIGYDRSNKIYTQIEGSKPLFTAGHRLAAFEIVEAVREHYP
ncbi:MAG: hypothetical protein JXQ79_06015 [Rhodobacteraceae bacterium]|nr:hypothetical protein [Paracoccaceae bacterium]